MTAVLELRDLRKSYRDLRRRTSVALDGLDLVIDRPGVFGLLGPNGSGKTTAIRCALGLVRPSGGSISVFGTDVAQLSTVAHRVGALVEGPKFTPQFSARTNLELLAGMGDVPRSRVHEVLEVVELSERADDPVSSFSLGMGQRLGIAAALLRQPDLIMLDEPTNGLDPAGIADVRRLVRRLADEGRSVLLSSHQLHEVQQVCDHVTIVRRGAVIADGTVAELIGRHAISRVVVVIDDRSAALDTLTRSGFSAMPGLETDHLVVQLPDTADSTDVNRILAHEGLFAREIRPDTVTLEDAFLTLTGDPAAPTHSTLINPTLINPTLTTENHR